MIQDFVRQLGKETLSPEEEIHKFSEKINTLVSKRKNNLTQIKQSLKRGEDQTHFLKCINLLDYSQALEEKYEKSVLLKNYYFLGTILSNSLDLPNSVEKIYLLWKILDEFQDFINKINTVSEKFLISNLSNISLNPFTLKMKFEIEDGQYEGPKFIDNVNTLFDRTGLMQNLSRKVIKINGSKYRFTDKKILTDFLVNWHKSLQLPGKLSYQVIVCSTSEILNMVYTMFMDEVYYNFDSYDLIEKIDDLVLGMFLQVIFKDLFKLSLEASENEFKNFDKIMTNAKTSKEGPPSFDSLISMKL